MSDTNNDARSEQGWRRNRDHVFGSAPHWAGQLVDFNRIEWMREDGHTLVLAYLTPDADVLAALLKADQDDWPRWSARWTGGPALLALRLFVERVDDIARREALEPIWSTAGRKLAVRLGPSPAPWYDVALPAPEGLEVEADRVEGIGVLAWLNEPGRRTRQRYVDQYGNEVSLWPTGVVDWGAHIIVSSVEDEP